VRQGPEAADGDFFYLEGGLWSKEEVGSLGIAAHTATSSVSVATTSAHASPSTASVSLAGQLHSPTLEACSRDLL
jgi:hypothetical protein